MLSNRLKYASMALVLLALIAGAVLRFQHLGDHSLWEDELFSVGVATRSGPWDGPLLIGKTMLDLELKDSFWSWKFADPHPPLYELLLTAWIGAFGASNLAIRSLSAVLGVLAMLSVFALPRAVDWPARAVYVILLAASGPLLIYSQDARNYSLGACLSAWMFVLLLRRIEEDPQRLREGRAGMALLVLGALFALTHFYGLVMAASIAVVMMLWAGSYTALMRASGSWCIAFLPIAVYIGLGQAGILTKLNEASATPLPLMLTLKNSGLMVMHNFYPMLAKYAYKVVLAFFLVSLVVVWRMRARKHPLLPAAGAALAVLALFSLMIFLGSRKAQTFSSRYVIFMVPGVLLLISLFGSVKGWPRWLSAALCVFLVPAGLKMWNVAPRPQNGGDWSGAAALVVSKFRPGDLIVVPLNDPTMRAHFEHYLRGPMSDDVLERRLISVTKPEDVAQPLRSLASLPSRIIVFTHGAFTYKSNLTIDVLTQQFPCVVQEPHKIQSLYVTVLACNGQAGH